MGAMNKDLWTKSIYDGVCPEWPCPTCRAGVLALEKDPLKHAATANSMRDPNEEWFGAEHVVHSFTAWAACTNQNCGEKFALAGTGGVEEFYAEDGGSQYVDVFYLRHCHPTLHMISVSENCPEAVRDALNSVYALYWTDRPSTAGADSHRRRTLAGASSVMRAN
ncbi:MAG TPA: hypothetical protein VLK85_25890 [Ramlibacter sp.]|nr:hypothetical protein [Ramlibacter sp.]